MPGFSPTLITFVELVAVFTGALSGGLTARRMGGYGLVGMGSLAFVTGLGGSLTRDLLLQQGTPVALTRMDYLVAVFAALPVSWFWGHRVGPSVDRAIGYLDAVGLGWFGVAGTMRCLGFGMGVAPAILLGLVTAIGGGVLRDLLIGEVPSVFRSGELYALAALAGILALVVCLSAGAPPPVAATLGLAVGTGVRLLSMHLGWRSPAPSRST